MTRVKELLRHKWILVLILVVVWFVLATVLKGVHTLELSTAQNTPVTQWLTDFASSIRGNRTQSPAFVYFFNPIRATIAGFVEAIRAVISVPASGNVIPLIGWLGTLSIIGYLVYVTSNLRTSLLSMGLLFACGLLGMWTFTMDTLAMTLGAVALSLMIGLPLGIWAGLNDKVMAVFRPGLDLAQILPTLVYLAPLALVFLIGIAAATIATLIYSVPICIRITAHAVRGLRAGPVEAAVSMGSTKWQLLRKVQLPMAKQTIILGVNQTTLAALSFVVIAALIGAPGLGKPVVDALIIRNVGNGVVAGSRRRVPRDHARPGHHRRRDQEPVVRAGLRAGPAPAGASDWSWAACSPWSPWCCRVRCCGPPSSPSSWTSARPWRARPMRSPRGSRRRSRSSPPRSTSTSRSRSSTRSRASSPMRRGT